MDYGRLLLISQTHRSGGTLFSQLLDGHSQIKVHPHELFIGKPNKWDWPTLNLHASPFDIFNELREDKISRLGATGLFIKPGSNRLATQQQVRFNYSEEEHRKLFVDAFMNTSVHSQRQAIQIYLSTFFEAWPENTCNSSSLYIACFLPHILTHKESFDRLLLDFPDVFMVNLIRNPMTWLASLGRHISLDFYDLDAVQYHLRRWEASVRKVLDLADIASVNSFVTSYEALVSDPPNQLKQFCSQAGLLYEQSMIYPTVGGVPVRPNSSFTRSTTSIDQSSLCLPEDFPDHLVSIFASSDYLALYEHACNKFGLEIYFKKSIDLSLGMRSLEKSSSLLPAKNADNGNKVTLSLRDEIATAVASLDSPAKRTSQPFPAIEVKDFLSPKMYECINKYFPSEQSMMSMPSRRTSNKAAHKYRKLFSLTNNNLECLDDSQRKFWLFFTTFVNKISSSLIDSLPSATADLRFIALSSKHIRTRIDLWRDQGGYQVSPHTDAPHKLATFLLYCSDCSSLVDQGTSIFVPKNTTFRCWAGAQYSFDLFDEVWRAKYEANRLFGFRKTDNSFHGKRLTKIADVPRRVIAITLQADGHYVA